MSQSRSPSAPTTTHPAATTAQDSDDASNKPEAIRIVIPSRYYMLPGAAVIVGTTIGLFRGSRTASLRFLAENAHRPPTTVQGWYFYNKTKNYRVILGGLRGAGADALRLGTTASGWVAIEQGCNRAGLGDFAEVAAGLGTAGMFSAVYRLPWRTTTRTLALGLMMGVVMRGLRWSRGSLEQRTAAIAAAGDDGRESGRVES